MLPGGFAFKLSSAGDLEWITPSDVIDGFLYSAVEIPDGSFLGLVDDCSGEFFLQRISAEGEILSTIGLDTEGVPCRGICTVNGTVWITSDISSGTVEWFRLDDEFCPDGSFSVEFQEEARIRYIHLDEYGLLAAGELSGDGFITCVGLEGGLLQLEVFDSGEYETFRGAFRREDGFGGYGTAEGPAGFSYLVVIQVWDSADQ
jgi:hypothetical protein